MPAYPEYKIAVGAPTGRRSTRWKFFVKRNDVYIVSGMIEKNCKISLHESGDCQFSGTDTWVTAVPGRRNADRFLGRLKFLSAISARRSRLNEWIGDKAPN
jgi:hypothetical protein